MPTAGSERAVIALVSISAIVSHTHSQLPLVKASCLSGTISRTRTSWRLSTSSVTSTRPRPSRGRLMAPAARRERPLSRGVGTLARHDRAFVGPAVAEQTHWRGHADALVRQQSLQVIDAADRLLRELGDDVPGPQSSPRGGTARGDVGDEHAASAAQVAELDPAPRELHRLASHTDVAPPDAPVAQETRDHEVRGVDRDGEADPLRARDDGGIDPDDLAARVHQQ